MDGDELRGVVGLNSSDRGRSDLGARQRFESRRQSTKMVGFSSSNNFGWADGSHVFGDEGNRRRSASAAGLSQSDATRVVGGAVRQVGRNLAILKARLLHTVGAPLDAPEKTMLLDGAPPPKDAQLEGYAELVTAAMNKAAAAALVSPSTSPTTKQLTATDSPAGRSSPLPLGDTLASVDLNATRPTDSPSPPLDPGASPEEAVNVVFDTMYRHAFEEMSLRLQSHQAEEAKKLAPRKTLDAAIAAQRGKADTAWLENKTLRSQVEMLEHRVSEVKEAAERKDAKHREQYNAFLKEICVLKEQLYRSYRDKKYVAKPVDLMELIIDDDNGEDVSIEQLLQYRRTVRGVEKQLSGQRIKIDSLQDEIKRKDEFIARVKEKQRTQEVGTTGLRQEISTLNDMTVKLEEENQQLKDKLELARMEIAAGGAGGVSGGGARRKTGGGIALDGEIEDVGVQCMIDVDEVKEADPPIDENAVPVWTTGASRLRVLRHLEITAKELKASELQHRATKAEFEAAKAEYARTVAELKARAEDAEVAQAAAEAKQKVAEAAQAAAEAARDEAEAKADRAVTDASTQAVVFAKELTLAQDAFVRVRAQNRSLCAAFLNVSERLHQIKTKAGLLDYKKRANDFHFRRAEAVIVDSRKKIDEANARADAAEEDAKLRVEHAHSMVRSVTADLESSEDHHRAEVSLLAERTDGIQRAFHSLLQDFNRLRAEHLKDANDLTEDEVKASIANVKDALSLASGDSTPAMSRHSSNLPPRTGSGKQRVSSAGQKQAAPTPPSPGLLQSIMRSSAGAADPMAVLRDKLRQRFPFESASAARERFLANTDATSLLKSLLADAEAAKAAIASGQKAATITDAEERRDRRRKAQLKAKFVEANRTGDGAELQLPLPENDGSMSMRSRPPTPLTEDSMHERVEMLTKDLSRSIHAHFSAVFEALLDVAAIDVSQELFEEQQQALQGKRRKLSSSKDGASAVSEGAILAEMVAHDDATADAAASDAKKRQIAWDRLRVFLSLEQRTRRMVLDAAELVSASDVVPPAAVRQLSTANRPLIDFDESPMSTSLPLLRKSDSGVTPDSDSSGPPKGVPDKRKKTAAGLPLADSTSSDAAPPAQPPTKEELRQRVAAFDAPAVPGGSQGVPPRGPLLRRGPTSFSSAASSSSMILPRSTPTATFTSTTPSTTMNDVVMEESVISPGVEDEESSVPSGSSSRRATQLPSNVATAVATAKKTPNKLPKATPLKTAVSPGQLPHERKTGGAGSAADTSDFMSVGAGLVQGGVAPEMTEAEMTPDLRFANPDETHVPPSAFPDHKQVDLHFTEMSKTLESRIEEENETGESDASSSTDVRKTTAGTLAAQRGKFVPGSSPAKAPKASSKAKNPGTPPWMLHKERMKQLSASGKTLEDL